LDIHFAEWTVSTLLAYLFYYVWELRPRPTDFVPFSLTRNTETCG
jgi:hypothetical protein